LQGLSNLSDRGILIALLHDGKIKTPIGDLPNYRAFVAFAPRN
jgi:hypothetical protein